MSLLIDNHCREISKLLVFLSLEQDHLAFQSLYSQELFAELKTWPWKKLSLCVCELFSAYLFQFDDWVKGSKNSFWLHFVFNQTLIGLIFVLHALWLMLFVSVMNHYSQNSMFLVGSLFLHLLWSFGEVFDWLINVFFLCSGIETKQWQSRL